MDKSEAASRLGIPEVEVIDVFDEDAGTIVKTFDGQAYIIVPDDRPDADGQTGLMFLSAPTPTYAGGFKVFAGEADAERVTEVKPAPKAKAS